MHGLPTDLDLSFFVGRQVVQLCLGQYQIQMHFDSDLTVSIDDAEFTLDGRRLMVDKGHMLAKLIGLTVGAARREPPGDLHLAIGDHSIVLHDSNVAFESYTIVDGLRVISV